MAITRLPAAALAASLLVLTPVAGALAHHGWAWAENEDFELTGTVESARLGNPHGEVTVTSSGARWVIEVGQPWRNKRAGLEDDMLRKGVTLTAIGHRSAKAGERLMKAERIRIGDRTFDLYPDRE